MQYEHIAIVSTNEKVPEVLNIMKDWQLVAVLKKMTPSGFPGREFYFTRPVKPPVVTKFFENGQEVREYETPAGNVTGG